LHVDVEREIAGAKGDAFDPRAGSKDRVNPGQASGRLDDRDQVDRAFL
jgi:hypothetical protein